MRENAVAVAGLWVSAVEWASVCISTDAGWWVWEWYSWRLLEDWGPHGAAHHTNIKEKEVMVFNKGTTLHEARHGTFPSTLFQSS
ncbi:hypothetical protein RRF57_004504 [Xylaria bambusicola]|uniref:Uncharacterized protein n=1 Tax=Xylaria bambusicola TaxID=326684 RepID=A0AAN7UWD2_9PEZI